MSLSITTYARSPRLNAVQAVALALTLLRRVPTDAPAPVRKAAKRLRDAVTELQSRRRVRRAAPGKKVDPRVAKAALDTAWAALRDALGVVARLPHERYPSAVAAQQLTDRLFPEALAFLKLEYNAIWVESDEALRALREKDTAAALAPLVHADLVHEVARAHKDFGDVIGMTADAAAAPGVDVGEALAAVTGAITAYAVQVVAASDDADEATVERYRVALEPIVERRARSRNGAKADADDEEGDDEEDAEEGKAQEDGDEKDATKPAAEPKGDAPANDTAPSKERVPRVA
jgi:hypothetical protein